MLLKNYPNILLENNETLKKLIENGSYLVVQNNKHSFPIYDVYINELLVGTITSNPVCCIKFISQNDSYEDVIIYNENFDYGQWKY